MKVLFILRAAGYFPYHQTTVDHLLARGHAVTLLFETVRGRPDDGGFEEWLVRHGDRVTVGETLKRSGRWRPLLFAAREVRSYASYRRRGPDARFYRDRWRRYIPLALGGAIRRFPPLDACFGWRATGTALAALERVAPPERAIVDTLRRSAPDCVVVSPTNLLADEEVEYVKAARSLGIPAIVPILSWDNLTTKGLLHVIPDLVLAWHHGHYEEARTIHGVPADRLVVTGSPFFDRWFDRSRPVGTRDVTCGRMGLDPGAPYLLYLGSSANIARDESWLVLALAQALRESADPALRRLQVVFKPHPGGSLRNVRALPQLDAAGISVWGRERGRPDTTEAIGQFRDALHHAVAVAGVNTTGMLDAVLCDRPCLALVVERYRTTQTDATHFQRMLESDALLVARSVRQGVQTLGRVLAGNDPTAPARRRFAATYARPRGLGADAGEAAAIAIELAARRLTADAITFAIDRELGARTAAGTTDQEPAPGEVIPVAR